MDWDSRISFSSQSGPCYGRIHTGDSAAMPKTQAIRSADDDPAKVAFLAELAERRKSLSTR